MKRKVSLGSSPVSQGYTFGAGQNKKDLNQGQKSQQNSKSYEKFYDQFQSCLEQACQQQKEIQPQLNKHFSSPSKKNASLKEPRRQNANLTSINSAVSLSSSASPEQSPQYIKLTRSYEQDSHDDNIIYEQEEISFKQFQDYILINGIRLNKPFVEKPIDAQNHNIYIYYPSKSGGGHKRLFRKVKNKSSEFMPGPCSVRKQGSYIYQNFLRTDGFDIKVYTVGPNYSHAQARKAPTLDGKVMRQANGKELRYPVLLTPHQKVIVRKIVQTFQQTVCGFDMLRSNGKSYVCDVNGLSFVKQSPKYYKDSGTMLRKIILKKFSPDLLDIATPQDQNANLIVPKILFKHRPVLGVVQQKHEELRAVVAIFRHGDRTPKQKMKMVVRHQDLLSFFKSQKDVTKQIKLKNPKKLQ